jgi:hypothetical protein
VYPIISIVNRIVPVTVFRNAKTLTCGRSAQAATVSLRPNDVLAQHPRFRNTADRPVTSTEGQGVSRQGSMVGRTPITYCLYELINNAVPADRAGSPLTSRQKIDCSGFYRGRGEMMTRKNCRGRKHGGVKSR